MSCGHFEVTATLNVRFLALTLFLHVAISRPYQKSSLDVAAARTKDCAVSSNGLHGWRWLAYDLLTDNGFRAAEKLSLSGNIFCDCDGCCYRDEYLEIFYSRGLLEFKMKAPNILERTCAGAGYAPPSPGATSSNW